MTTIRVLHNTTVDADGRPAFARHGEHRGIPHPGDTFREVFTFGSPACFVPMGDTGPDAYLSIAWEITQVGVSSKVRASEYAERGVRSTCVGDVFAVDERLYAVLPYGFAQIEGPLNVMPA